MDIRFLKVKIRCEQHLTELPAKKCYILIKNPEINLNESFYFVSNPSACFYNLHLTKYVPL